jgi:hypothetical protein
MPFGVASLSSLISGTNLQQYQIDAYATRNVKATWTRMYIPWNELEPSKNSFNWTQFDYAVYAAAMVGLKILCNIIGPAPVWAQAPGGDPNATGAPPADPANFGRIAGIIANRYKQQISSWEIWNEPNIPKYFAPPDATRYSALLTSAYSSIKAVQPNSTVVSGGLSSSSEGIESVAFLKQMYDAGAGNSFDAVGLHPYTYPYAITADPQGRNNAVPNAYTLMISKGQAAKKIWITEYGQATGTATGSTTEAQQSAIIVDFLQRVSQVPFLGPVFIFTTRDTANTPATLDANFGLYTVDWKPKQVVGSLQTLNP